MSYDLESIKKIRVKLGLSQKDLANQCKISPSMLNQIEKGNANPSFDTAKTIFNILESKNFSNQIKAGDISTRSITYLSPADSLGRAIDKMKKGQFSQIPIFSAKKCVGMISEGMIAKHPDNPNYTLTTRISKIMEPAPPIFPSDFPASQLSNIISISGCVLVAKNSELIGIITSQDLLKLIK